MYIKPLNHGSFSSHVTTVGTVVRTLVIVIVLIVGCDACTGTRSPSRKPSTKPSVSPSTNRPVSTSATPSDTSQFQNFLCFSTTVENLTNETIDAKLGQLSDSGNLSRLFIYDAKKQDVFLKWSKPNDTGCLKGYVIEIRNISSDNDTRETYEYDIMQLNQTLTTRYCKNLKDCGHLAFSADPTPPTSTQTKGSKATDTTATRKQASTESGGKHTGTAAAGKTDDGKDGVSTTIIIIPVVAVVLFIIVVIVVALWFKRRSAGKENKGNESSGDRFAGPLNGDVYTVVNPGADRKKNEKSDSDNDLVYTELSHIKPRGNGESKQPEQEQTDYADITHILTAGETTYQNVTPRPQTDQAYSNVAELNSANL